MVLSLVILVAQRNLSAPNHFGIGSVSYGPLYDYMEELITCVN